MHNFAVLSLFIFDAMTLEEGFDRGLENGNKKKLGRTESVIFARRKQGDQIGGIFA
jgi:hypothetical protein